jgi:hypothetical protein
MLLWVVFDVRFPHKCTDIPTLKVQNLLIEAHTPKIFLTTVIIQQQPFSHDVSTYAAAAEAQPFLVFLDVRLPS